jgi:uncharacterized membrane protein YhaH (DUF805 family)
MALFFVIVAIGGKIKDSDSQILSVIISFWGLLEFFLYIVMGILALRDHSLSAILSACIAIWILLIVINVVFVIIFRKRILKDESFLYWKSVFPHSYRAILIISVLFSFKFSRMYYSRFLGLDNFCCGFTTPNNFLLPINIASAVNVIL